MFSGEILYSNTAHSSRSPERTNWVKQESAMILAKNIMAREKSKNDWFNKRTEKDRIIQKIREDRLQRWKDKTKNSPFAVNLVAEDERIYEENQIRSSEEKERLQQLDSRRTKAKNDIILKALSEFSDLEVLRREKRAIMEEEQRLKALLVLEKTRINGKADRMAAERAQKQRSQAKLEYRRAIYKDSLEQVMTEQAEALRKKHAVSLSGAKSKTSTSSF